MAKIMLHLCVEISDDGKLSLSKSGWSLVRAAGSRGPLSSGEVVAVRDGFEGHHLDNAGDVDQDESIVSPVSRSMFPEGTGPADPHLTEAARALMKVGVSPALATKLTADKGSARAFSVAKWMAEQPQIINADGLAAKLMNKQGGTNGR